MIRTTSKRSWTEEQLIQAVESSTSFAEVIEKLGLKVRSGNYATVRKYIMALELPFDHLNGSTKKKAHSCPTKRPDEDIFVENSTYSTSRLFERLIPLGIVQKCSVCGLLPIWQDKPLKLQVDHINGISTDHRLENLRLICPNCHSQTSTYSGRNKLSKLIK